MKIIIRAQIVVAILLVAFGIAWGAAVHDTPGRTYADGHYTSHTNTGTIALTVVPYSIVALSLFYHLLRYTQQPEPPAGAEFQNKHVPSAVAIFLGLNGPALMLMFLLGSKKPNGMPEHNRMLVWGLLVIGVGVVGFHVHLASALKRIPETRAEREDAAELGKIDGGTRAD